MYAMVFFCRRRRSRLRKGKRGKLCPSSRLNVSLLGAATRGRCGGSCGAVWAHLVFASLWRGPLLAASRCCVCTPRALSSVSPAPHQSSPLLSRCLRFVDPKVEFASVVGCASVLVGSRCSPKNCVPKRRRLDSTSPVFALWVGILLQNS